MNCSILSPSVGTPENWSTRFPSRTRYTTGTCWIYICKNQSKVKKTYSEQLSDFRVCINVDVEILELSIMSFDGINQHWFENVARATPGCASLDQDGTLSVLQRILPVSLIFHLLNVRWLIGGGFVSVGGCIWGTAIGRGSSFWSVKTFGHLVEESAEACLACGLHAEHHSLVDCEDWATQVCWWSRSS